MNIINCDNCGCKIALEWFSKGTAAYCDKCAQLFGLKGTAFQEPFGGTGELATSASALPERSFTKFYFCESCGKRITDTDIERGTARDKKLKGIYCKNCAVGVMTVDFAVIRDVPTRTPSASSSGVSIRTAASPTKGSSASGLKPAKRSSTKANGHVDSNEMRTLRDRKGVLGLGIMVGIGAVAVAIVLFTSSSKTIIVAPKSGKGGSVASDPVRTETPPALKNTAIVELSNEREHSGPGSQDPNLKPSDDPGPDAVKQLIVAQPVQESLRSGRYPLDLVAPAKKMNSTPPEVVDNVPIRKQGESENKASAGEISVDLGGVNMELVLIPAGEFMMGSDSGSPREMPLHKVRISKSFYMGKFVVTQAQYKAIMGKNPSRFKGDNLPVDYTRYYSAEEFCRRASEVTKKAFRLPTEAEWEYACRAGTQSRFNIADKNVTPDQIGWFKQNSAGKTHPVGEKKPNSWGLYDMHGNVTEWCEDWFASDYYSKSPVDDPQGPAHGETRVLRGGAHDWGLNTSYSRRSNDPNCVADGFRVVLVQSSKFP